MERLQEQFKKKITPALIKEFGFENPMQVPIVHKIVINVGTGKYQKDSKYMESIVNDLTQITGQKPVVTKAKKSIAGFKIREKQPIGLMVTLRGYRMWAFLDKLVNIALPRVKDFRGIPANSFDGRGNYHLGLKEQIVFPEVSPDAIEHIFGLQVSIVTTAKTDDQARALLTHFKFPFKKTTEE